MYVAGIDVGSVATKVILLDSDLSVAAYKVVTIPPSAESAEQLLEECLAESGIPRGDVANIVATGYGRMNVGFANSMRTEILCHSTGVNRLCPSVRTVIDIGGQDSKVIKISPVGSVLHFEMNDKCAAGTGRFLEVMTQALDIGLEEWGDRVAGARRSVRISSVCTVFAETEVISKVAARIPIDDVLAGICESIATRVGQMARRLNVEKDVCFTGGVAINRGVVMKLGEFLGERLFVPGVPQSTGALGAALIAARESATPST